MAAYHILAASRCRIITLSQLSDGRHEHRTIEAMFGMWTMCGLNFRSNSIRKRWKWGCFEARTIAGDRCSDESESEQFADTRLANVFAGPQMVNCTAKHWKCQYIINLFANKLLENVLHWHIILRRVAAHIRQPHATIRIRIRGMRPCVVVAAMCMCCACARLTVCTQIYRR